MSPEVAVPNLLTIAWLLPLASFVVISIGFSIPQLFGSRASYAVQPYGAYIAIGAIEGTLDQATTLPSIDPYMNITLAVVVEDHNRSKFRTREQIRNYPGVKLGVIKRSFFADRAPKLFSEDSLVELESASEYFDGRYEEIDALVISAEKGAAWTMRKPQFSVNNPLKGQIRVPLYYLTASDHEFEAFLQNWLTLKRTNGTYDQLYQYWILGTDEKELGLDGQKHSRWSIIKDVLRWVE